MTGERKYYVGLIAFSLIMFLTGNWLLPVTDPTESNYVETAKEMLAAGEYVSPLIYGHSWYDKPIMFYWELVTAFALLGTSDFAARFFPALFATVGVCLTYFFGKTLYDRWHGLVAAVILVTTVEYWYVAHAVITDMTLFCAISAALISFYLGYSRQNPRYYYLSYAAAGVGMLTKGPIALALPGLIILIFLAWQRDIKHLLKVRFFSGLALFAAVASVWYLPMYLRHGREFTDTFFGVHNVLRATVSEHPAQNVWYYYLMIFVAGFVPWIFPLLIRGAAGLRNFWRERKFPALDMRQRFLLTWALTVPLLFQSFATKYVTYTLPYMLPVSILFAGYYAQHKKLWRYMAATTSLVFMSLLFFVAPPFCREYSGQEEAAALNRLLPAEDCYIVSCRGGYSASLVFYSGKTVYRLEEAAGIEKLKPHKMNWSSTNVMPFMPIEKIPADKPAVAIVDDKKAEFFRQKATGAWKLLGETAKVKFYLRTAIDDKSPR